MKRLEIIESLNLLCETHNLQKQDIYINAGSALCLHGIRHETDDIDVSLSFKNLPKYLLSSAKYLDDFEIWICSLGKIDLHFQKEGVDPFDDIRFRTRKPEYSLQNGFMVETLESVLDFKRVLNRPKDQKDILEIERQLGLD